MHKKIRQGCQDGLEVSFRRMGVWESFLPLTIDFLSLSVRYSFEYYPHNRSPRQEVDEGTKGKGVITTTQFRKSDFVVEYRGELIADMDVAIGCVLYPPAHVPFSSTLEAYLHFLLCSV